MSADAPRTAALLGLGDGQAKLVWKSDLGPGEVKQGVKVGETIVLMREPKQVMAVDLKTGAVGWSYAP
ncbi:MAG: hypothetical protein JNK82_00965 [Myxococcaceae bacterium]|nr:hypothetical protein [Myxococcaceae bacterium]